MTYWPQCLGITMFILLIVLAFSISAGSFGKRSLYSGGIDNKYIGHGYDYKGWALRIGLILLMGVWLFTSMLLTVS